MKICSKNTLLQHNCCLVMVFSIENLSKLGCLLNRGGFPELIQVLSPMLSSNEKNGKKLEPAAITYTHTQTHTLSLYIATYHGSIAVSVSGYSIIPSVVYKKLHAAQ